MADVFISYHEESAGELAQQIAEALEKAGISCWIARRDMPHGGDFAHEIPPQIAVCKLFLLLLNEKAYQSKHIESETGLAFRRLNRRNDIIILPVETGEFTMIETGWIAYYLVQIQSVKLFHPNMVDIRELARKIAQLLGKTPPPSPQNIIARGQCGTRVTYTLYTSGQLVISGNGSISDYRFDQPWYTQRMWISNIRIQNGVTGIGAFAFWRCCNLTSISIPSSVSSISSFAFSRCENLPTVSIPDSVSSIGKGAFYDCKSLKSIDIPNSLTYIDESTFYNCESLTNISIPTSVRSIGEYAFSNCIGLTSVNIPDSVFSIERGAFDNCYQLKSVSVPANVKINYNAFYNRWAVTRRSK